MDDLTPPVVSQEVYYIWELYLDIRKGSVAVGYLELVAFQQVTGYELTPFESGLLLEIDILRNSDD